MTSTVTQEERQKLFEDRQRSIYPAITEQEANLATTKTSFSLIYHPTVGTLNYVGWGGKTATVTGQMSSLGFDYGRRERTPRRGLRRAVYDFCYGYVSGIPVKDILWYIYSRSLSQKRLDRHLARERKMNRSA